MSLKIRSILVIVIGSALGLSLSLGGRLIGGQSSDSAAIPELLAEVMERVREDYVEQVSDQELLEGAIRGMVGALDPHSQFLDSDEYEDIRISTTGNYSGVGLEVSLENNAVTVVSPFADTPAERAGILSGDTIISIDDYPVNPERLSDAIARMRGKAGSQVSLAIARDSEEEILNFRLTRAFVKVASVRHELMDDGFAYARVSQFSETTTRDLRKAIEKMRDENGDQLAGLVLDLRNNPGGILDSAVSVSDLFLDNGVIVTANGRGQDAKFAHTARTGDVMRGASIVVIVNEGSASASEIVAAALQENDRATVVGVTTFGKGSVQTVMPLSSGNAIKLTTSRYFTPSGESIHEKGIQPDFVIPAGEDALSASVVLSGSPSTEKDQQFARAVELLRQPYIVNSKAP